MVSFGRIGWGVAIGAMMLAACSSSGTGGGGGGGGGGSSSSSGGASDGGTSDDAGTGTGAKKALGDACAKDADCESNACFLGGQQSYCSLRCTAADAASTCGVAPFTGACNNQGYCRKP